ncbi:MAG: hydrolase [Cutibacterium avidum]|uniref:hydrolase n=1 Tax=Cutibacterium avidum TaxID=33010 RepID=UPI001C322E14|nr:hydrolase [Cutibacterium avidum]MDK7364130.1 hydrolase [Cutibacterium avidum]MDU1360513.1 hydrolase [Cutibacterium avidum]MDU1417705.1 hydrolase [Cutibacterium avidum]MDU1726021.1 hydrolase [Cutibacterium avidum]MDU2371495.1 hydrolase [Cutibacterium avidum]
MREHWAEFDLEPFHGTVQHLFIHQIIPFPHVAFASEEGQDFDDWYITRSEAVALLDELRARRYVLVSLADCFVPRGHAVVPNPELRVPRGHNPLVLSIDDLSFNRFLLGKGFMDRIIIDSTGHLSSIGKDPSTGRQFKEPTNCIVGLLDGYLRAHPEFSLNGAAATLALTGYEGILGYRTDRHERNRAAQQEAVKPIIALMRKRGWTFASHSYGHIDLGSKWMTREWVTDDTAKWKREVGELLGPTSLYITPFGSLAALDGPLMKVIREAGFDVICDVSDGTTVNQRPDLGLVVQSRVHVDGYGMRHTPHIYRGFFDVDKVFDHRHRLARWGHHHL